MPATSHTQASCVRFGAARNQILDQSTRRNEFEILDLAGHGGIVALPCPVLPYAREKEIDPTRPLPSTPPPPLLTEGEGRSASVYIHLPIQIPSVRSYTYTRVQYQESLRNDTALSPQASPTMDILGIAMAKLQSGRYPVRYGVVGPCFDRTYHTSVQTRVCTRGKSKKKKIHRTHLHALEIVPAGGGVMGRDRRWLPDDTRGGPGPQDRPEILVRLCACACVCVYRGVLRIVSYRPRARRRRARGRR